MVTMPERAFRLASARGDRERNSGSAAPGNVFHSNEEECAEYEI